MRYVQISRVCEKVQGVVTRTTLGVTAGWRITRVMLWWRPGDGHVTGYAGDGQLTGHAGDGQMTGHAGDGQVTGHTGDDWVTLRWEPGDGSHRWRLDDAPMAAAPDSALFAPKRNSQKNSSRRFVGLLDVLRSTTFAKVLRDMSSDIVYLYSKRIDFTREFRSFLVQICVLILVLNFLLTRLNDIHLIVLLALLCDRHRLIDISLTLLKRVQLIVIAWHPSQLLS